MSETSIVPLCTQLRLETDVFLLTGERLSATLLSVIEHRDRRTLLPQLSDANLHNTLKTIRIGTAEARAIRSTRLDRLGELTMECGDTDGGRVCSLQHGHGGQHWTYPDLWWRNEGDAARVEQFLRGLKAERGQR